MLASHPIQIQAGCKFVDAVEPECPYIMNDEYLLHIIDKWKIDYVVHGDDPCIVDGKGSIRSYIGPT
jgi:glycerol-3-phosphate cytidylyltransferase-like family protein